VNEFRLPATAVGSLLMIILRIAFVSLALLLLPPASRAQGKGGDEVNLRRLQQAVGAISEGRLPEAEGLLNSVLSGSPRDADALNLLGVVRAQQKRAQDAERLFRRALAAEPAHVSAHINLGELFVATGREKEEIGRASCRERV